MAELSDCYQPSHHYQAPQLACWPATLESGSFNGNQPTGATLYSPYLTTAAARVGNLPIAGISSPTEVQQVLAVLSAASTANTASQGNMRDSRWLTLEVCRQYQRKMCSRDENECKFAHPPTHVDVQNGRVICCYDSIKGKCQRRDPACKYFHPPQHLRELLLQNGRTNLILKNMQLQLLQHQLAQGALLPGLSGALVGTTSTPNGASPGTVSTHGIAGTPNSPPTSTSIGPTGKLIYSHSPSLNLNPQGVVTAYSLMGVSLSPYLTPTQLNSMAVARLKSVPPSVPLTNGNDAVGLSAAHLAAMAAVAENASVRSSLNMPATPAKRPALADAKSGLPMFDYGQGLYALQAQAQLLGVKGLQLPPSSLQPQFQSPPKKPATLGTCGITASENGVESHDKGGLSELEVQKPQFVTVGQLYPKTYIEIPQYGYQ